MPQGSFAQPRRRSPALSVLGSLLALPLAFAGTAARSQAVPRGGGGGAAENQVVITASRLPATPGGLAQNVTIIDQKQVQEMNPGRVEDLLGRLTGVYVDRAGKSGGFSSLYMRGAENSHLLLMIDGVKVNDPTTTRGSAYDLSSIDVSQIERVEVLRGPASAIHGGEALAGVLNIVTRRATQQGFSGSAYAAVGQQGHRKLGGTLTLGADSLRGQISVGASRDGNLSEGRQRLNDLSGSLRLTPGPSIEAEVFVRRTERASDAFPDDSGGPRLAINRELTRRDATDTAYGASVATGQASSLRLQASVTVYERDERANNVAVDPGVRFPVPAFSSDTNFRRTTLNATVSRQWGTAASVVAGLERQQEDGGLNSLGDFDFDGNPDALAFNLKRRTDSVFAEGRVRLVPPLSVQVGVRRDRVQGLSAVTTPHLGAVWDLPNGATTLKATYSKGFKPPSFFALGFPIGANPNLRPERSSNAELTLAHRFGSDSSLEVSVFEIDYKDLVDFTVDPNTFVPLNINRGTIVVKGVEPALTLRVTERLRAQLGLTLLDINEEDGLAPLRNRPERRAHASLVYDFDAGSSLLVAASTTGSFLDRSNPTADITMPGFTTVDLAYALQFGKHTRLKLALDNALNKRYEQFVGFAAQERRIRLELRSGF